jgi:hypothetical protein
MEETRRKVIFDIESLESGFPTGYLQTISSGRQSGKSMFTQQQIGRFMRTYQENIKLNPTRTKMNRIKHLEKKIIKNFKKNPTRIPIWQEEIFKLEGEILSDV